MFGFSAYLVPAVIALLSLWALMSWPMIYPEAESRKVVFQALLTEQELTDPARAKPLPHLYGIVLHRKGAKLHPPATRCRRCGQRRR